MGHMIVKVDRRTNRYMVWSSTTNDVIFWGDRKDIRKFMLKGFTLGEILEDLDGVLNKIEAKIAKVNEFGSDDRTGEGWWDDHGLVWEDGFIFRSDFGKLFELLDTHWRSEADLSSIMRPPRWTDGDVLG